MRVPPRHYLEQGGNYDKLGVCVRSHFRGINLGLVDPDGTALKTQLESLRPPPPPCHRQLSHKDIRQTTKSSVCQQI